MANLRVGTGITFDGATGNFNALGIGTVRGALNATGAINASSGLNVTGTVAATAVTGEGSGITGITSTALPAGTVLQVVSNTYTTSTSNTTATFADTGLSATINISAGSKVLIMCVQHLDIQRSNTGCRCAVKLLRGSTDIFAPANSKNIGLEGDYSSVQKVFFLPLHFSFLDTGASTGSNTYKLQARVTSASDSSRIRTQDDSNPSTMTLLEIAG